MDQVRARYGLQQADSDCFGLLVDETETFFRDIISQLLNKSRVRNQASQSGMSKSKPGDTCDIGTVTYVGQTLAPDYTAYGGSNGQGGPYGRPKQVVMFEPKQSTSLSLICTENQNQEFSYLLNTEYNQMREKHELLE